MTGNQPNGLDRHSTTQMSSMCSLTFFQGNIRNSGPDECDGQPSGMHGSTFQLCCLHMTFFLNSTNLKRRCIRCQLRPSKTNETMDFIRLHHVSTFYSVCELPGVATHFRTNLSDTLFLTTLRLHCESLFSVTALLLRHRPCPHRARVCVVLVFCLVVDEFFCLLLGFFSSWDGCSNPSAM